VFAAHLAGLEIPKQPVVVGYKPLEFAVPFVRELFVQRFEVRKQRAFRLESPLVGIERDVLFPAKLLPVRLEPESVKDWECRVGFL
jgi:hypothetical protein